LQGHVRSYHDPSDLDRKNESDFSILHFLVATNRLHYIIERKSICGRNISHASDDFIDCCSLTGVDHVHPLGYAHGCAHTVPDGFAVQKPSVARHGFKRMPYGVAEVEYAAKTSLALVARYDIGFDSARARDHIGKRIVVKSFHLLHIAGDAVEQLPISDDAIFDGFAETGSHLSRRKRM
jgi:hypothetical protein